MNNWKKYTFAAVIVTAAGFAWVKTPHRNIPADLRDAVADNGFDTSIPSFENGAGNIPEPKAEAVKDVNKGYVAGNDPSAGAPAKPVEWVAINGGKFTMGTDSDEIVFSNARPIHEVTIKTFDMSKTAVTVEQYAECVIKGACTEPGTGGYCNWGKPARQLHPINCVDWNQAQAYAKFKGVRLPSEAEFEYAATSGGKSQKYPWGNDEPTSKLAVFKTRKIMPVCSKPKGNTAQGLCDMSGNVWQWVQDMYQNSYEGMPADGSAFEGASYGRVIRGGSFYSDGASYLRADYRFGYGPRARNEDIGFRLARSK